MCPNRGKGLVKHILVMVKVLNTMTQSCEMAKVTQESEILDDLIADCSNVWDQLNCFYY